MRIGIAAVLTALCLNVCLFSVRAADDPVFLGLAKNIEAAAQKGDSAALDGMVDTDAFCERVRGITAGNDQAYYKGFVQGFKSKPALTAMFIEAAKTGSFTLLRMHMDGTQQRALFRMNGTSGINYFDTIMEKDVAGKPHVFDVYVFVTGEYLSETVKVIYQAGLREQNPSVFDKIFGGGATIVDLLPKMQTMRQQLAAQNFKGVLATFDSIAKEQRTWKPIMTMRIQAASKVSQELWMEAIADYERAYPKDAALTLVKLDAFLLQKKFDEALNSIDTLDKAVGGDPFLNVYRTNTCTLAGRSEQAKTFAQKAVAEMPNSLDAHGALLDSSVAAKDYAGAVKELDVFAAKWGWDDAGLMNNPSYAEFFKTKEYKDWKAGRK